MFKKTCGVVLFLILGCASKREVTIVTPFKDRINVDYSDMDKKARVLIDSGLNKYVEGDYIGALPLLESASFLENMPLSVRRVLFYCYMVSGQYQVALKLSEDLLKEAPVESISYEQIGIANLWLGNINVSINNFKKALEFEQFSPKVYFFLGIAYEKKNDIKSRDANFENAEKEYQQILKTNPLDFDSNYELAELYIYWKKKLENVSNLLGALKEGLFKSDYITSNELYEKYYIPFLVAKHKCLIGDYNESLEILYNVLGHKAAAFGPHLVEIYFYIGKNHLMSGNRVKAQSFFERVKLLDPNSPYVSIIAKELKR